MVGTVVMVAMILGLEEVTKVEEGMRVAVEATTAFSQMMVGAIAEEECTKVVEAMILDLEEGTKVEAILV